MGELESIVLDTKRQTQKTAYCMISFIKMSRIGKFIKTGSELVVRGGGENRIAANGPRFLSGFMRMF